MISIRKASDRFHTRIGWLDSWHTFSFGDHHDPNHTGFSVLRVINDDRVQPAQGFGAHGHRDMEIISYVLEGALSHQDSMGNGSTIRPGDLQRMSAGTGVVHSEFNHSKTEPVHFLQIWIRPEREGVPPSYEQKHFAPEDLQNQLRLLASPDSADGSVRINQDVKVFGSKLGPGGSVTHKLMPDRNCWLHAATGTFSLNGVVLQAGDGARIRDEEVLEMSTSSTAELILFDLP
jgi:quercetin 2,3-dioxygenase